MHVSSQGYKATFETPWLQMPFAPEYTIYMQTILSSQSGLQFKTCHS
jgi:hypothetical protein